MSTNRHVTTREAARRLGIAPRSARKLLLDRGASPISTVGRAFLWREADVRKIECDRDHRYNRRVSQAERGGV